jgi:hypothetical protein
MSGEASVPAGSEQAIVKWEYKIVYIHAARWTKTGLPTELNQDFDAWGAEGWELVGTEAVDRQGLLSLGSYTSAIVAFFKRRID